MVKKGKLIKWDNKKGFGFIQFDTEDRQIFVHISAFPKKSGKPQLNESLAFQIGRDEDGKNKAVDIRLLDREIPTQKKPKQKRKTKDSNPIFVFIVFCLLAVGGFYAYKNINQIKRFLSIKTEPTIIISNERDQKQIDVINTQNFANNSNTADAKSNFQCRGRTYCSQMSSCADAKWVLNHCPNTEMDGDNDGIPCEKQFCN